MGDSFERMPGFAPGGKAAGDYKHLESEFLQLVRHPGAGCFSLSCTVEINLVLLGQFFDFFNEIVGLNANRSGNALGVGIIVAVAADIGNDEDVVGIGGHSSG